MRMARWADHIHEAHAPASASVLGAPFVAFVLFFVGPRCVLSRARIALLQRAVLGEDDCHASAFAKGALKAYMPAMHGDEALDDGEAQPRAAMGGRHFRIGMAEEIEDVGLIFGRYSDAGIRDCQRDLTFDSDGDAHFDLAVLRSEERR